MATQFAVMLAAQDKHPGTKLVKAVVCLDISVRTD
jgi:hypothetical protein